MKETSKLVVDSIHRKARRIGSQKDWQKVHTNGFIKPAMAMLMAGSVAQFDRHISELSSLYVGYRRNSLAVYHLMEVDMLSQMHVLCQRIRLLKGLQTKAQNPEFCAEHPLLTNKGQCFQREKRLDQARLDIHMLLSALRANRNRGIGKFVF